VTVYLVGAGPGDPGLLTCRAAQLLSQADVVVHDRLAHSFFVGMVRPGAELIDVGKRPGSDVAQDQINAELVRLGRLGLETVRLKGGDPFVFGRGGEEAAALRAAGIPFEVVPGVTSAVAVPAYAGIPVTQRGLSAGFTVVTGHRQTGSPSVPWSTLAGLEHTLVVLMGASEAKNIASELLAAGMGASTPVAAISSGTLPEQKVLRFELGQMAEQILEPPVTVVIGGVAEFDLSWPAERHPLSGRRIVVTRSAGQAGELADLLTRVGAVPVVAPVIEIVPPADGGADLQATLSCAAEYEWLVFTSVNAVEAAFARVRDARALAGPRVAAIGPTTAARLAQRGIVVDLVPARSTSEGLVEAIGRPGSGRILLVRAEEGRKELVQGLVQSGYSVRSVTAYRTLSRQLDEEQVKLVQRSDAVAFTSASTVHSLLDSLAGRPLDPPVACIGPITAEAARARGLAVEAVAARPDMESLVEALSQAVGGR
jgi:uroporphyrinogen III methyltransferase/synthase